MTLAPNDIGLENDRLFTPKEAAQLLRVSISWLAKRRMAGDGPLFLRIGRNIRYSELALRKWLKARQRLSTVDA